MQTLRTIVLAGAFAALATPAFADRYKIDAEHSNVNFKVGHLLSKTSGAFTDFQGEFDFDAAKKSGGALEAKIKAASIDTNNVKRDEHLRSADFFDAAKYPELVFKSRKVELGAGNALTIEGDLTIRGVTKPVVLKGSYTGEVKDPWGNVKAGFKANTSIQRKDFGIVWNKALDAGGFVLGEEVEIELLVEAENLTAGKKQAAE